MKCPTCTDITLVPSDRHGVEIGGWPQCRGVWPDRGELDQRVERSATMAPAERTATGSQTGFADAGDEQRRHTQGNRQKSRPGHFFD